jgi:hypothetical protein
MHLLYFVDTEHFSREQKLQNKASVLVETFTLNSGSCYII